MDTQTIQRLVDINRKFYREFAAPFAQTRMRLQPGVLRLLPRIPAGASVLDLGCGSAETAHWIASNGRLNSYIGWDVSADLLKIAAERAYPFDTSFRQVDLLDAPWQELSGLRFDRIMLFAVLHHIPGLASREAVLRALTKLLPDGGQLWMSNWQFLRDPKYAARVLPWSEADIDPRQLEPEDYLLDWRHGGRGLRYVHVIHEEERAHLIRLAGCVEKEFFLSDGNLRKGSDYSVWEKI
jgi:tRNA (uracil-5-)-methyltransferase TRM9